MNGLLISNWQQWESICCHLMQHLVMHNYHVHLQYKTYGTRGQSQYGIDLVPFNSQLAVVGQCKLKDGSLTWANVLADVYKTDYYPSPIIDYIFFTTANRHTTIQDIQNSGGYIHERKDGSKFPVRIVYWEDIQNINFIPQIELVRLFPDVFRMVASSLPVIENKEYAISVKAMKQFIPTKITLIDLAWLESWDFSVGYIPLISYKPFDDLYIEYTRVDAYKTYSIEDFIKTGSRLDILDCLPGANMFFTVLSDFRNLINAQTIGNNINGNDILTLEGLDRREWHGITSNWRYKANELARVYRSDILGEEQY